MAPRKSQKQKVTAIPAYVSAFAKSIDKLCESIDKQRDDGRLIK
jgi:hypothetical protein